MITITLKNDGFYDVEHYGELLHSSADLKSIGHFFIENEKSLDEKIINH